MVDLEKPETAAKIFGFAEALGLNGHFNLDPVDKWEVNQSLKKLDQVMDKTKMTQLWSEGKKMQYEEVLKIAMG